MHNIENILINNMYQQYANFFEKIKLNPNKKYFESILKKRAVDGISVISSTNSNGLACNFSLGLNTSEANYIDEFLSLFFDTNEITLKNVEPIIKSIQNNFNKFEEIQLMKSVDIIEMMFIIEEINLKHHNLFKCLEFCLILSKLEQMEKAIKQTFGFDVAIKINNPNNKLASGFNSFYNLVLHDVREQYTNIIKNKSYTTLQTHLNFNKNIWALLWSVYANEFNYLHKVESKYKIDQNKLKELFVELYGYHIEKDETGKVIEKFSTQENTEKFNTFNEICHLATRYFYSIVNSYKSDEHLSHEKYEAIGCQVIEQIIEDLNDINKTLAKKYLPKILSTEIEMCMLLQNTTNSIDTTITQLEKDLGIGI